MAESGRRCHYEVLGLRLDCSADEIKPAYRKLALQLHPDKLVQSGLSQAEATAKFQELSHAYEVLSDPKERAWYDSHRSKILFADPSSNSSVPDLFSFFSNSVFSGYSSNSKKSFFRVYSEVFSRVYSNELEFARKMGLGPDAVREAPAMGDLDSPYSQASAFYSYWTGFVTVMDFCWADAFDAASGPSRKVRRMMEDENAKLRRKARREYNETVRGLAEFVKKRDKRVIDMAVKRKEEEEKRKEEVRERKRKEERERIERAMAYREPDWSQTIDGEDDEIEDDNDDETPKEEVDEELYCVACGKKFKSDKQWKNHEQSKKHKEKVAQIRREVVDDDDEFDEDEVEELGEMMRDTVRIDDVDDEEQKVGSHNEANDADEKEDEEAKYENVVEELGKEVKDDNAVEDEDEIVSLEAMLGGRKNRKKAAVTTRKVEDNDDESVMEYNNRKATRKSRRAKKGKNVSPEPEPEPEKGVGVAKEEQTDENTKQSDKNIEHRVDKKSVVSKSKASSKGKKAKASSKNTDHTCEKCGEDFESKNKLYKHLSDTGHATIKNR